MYWLKTQILQNSTSCLLNVATMKGATVQIFTPQTSANAASWGHVFFPGELIRCLPVCGAQGRLPPWQNPACDSQRSRLTCTLPSLPHAAPPPPARPSVWGNTRSGRSTIDARWLMTCWGECRGGSLFSVEKRLFPWGRWECLKLQEAEKGQ